MKFSNYISCVLIFTLTILSGTAQTIRWGETLTSENKRYTPKVLGDDESFFYIVTKEAEKILLEKFSKEDLQKVYSVYIGSVADNEVQEGIYLMKNSYVVLTSRYNKKENTQELFAEVFGRESGETRIARKSMFSFPVHAKYMQGSYNVSLSKDRTKLMINFTAFIGKDESWSDRFYLLDEELNILTQREDKILKKEMNYRAFNYTIDNEGSVYYIKTYESGKTYIVSYDASQEYEKWEAFVDLSDMERDMQARRLHFALNNNNDLILAGYYTTDDNYIVGTFSMKISTSSKEVLYKKYNKFDKATLSQLVTKDMKDMPGDTAIPGHFYNSIDVLPTSDGGYVWVADFKNLMPQDGTAFVRDIMVAAHASDGSLMWARRIPMKQKGFINTYGIYYSLDYLSYFAHLGNGKVVIWQNEKDEFAHKTYDVMCKMSTIKPVDMYYMKERLTVIYTFDITNGDVKKELMGPVLTDVFIKPTMCYQQSFDSDAIFFSQKDNSFRFGIIKYQPPM